MILLTVLLIALILTTALIVVPTIFHYRAKWLRIAVAVGVAVSVFFGIATISTGSVATNRAEWLKAESADIMLYYNTVNYSDNEYVRYDFYDRVKAYNEVYAAYQEATEDPLTSWLYDADVLTECGYIDFMLNTGTYG